MGQVSVTRRYSFSAAHKLCNPQWSDAQNRAVFGPCANDNWHGHNFILEVTLKGNPGQTGLVVEPGRLDSLIESEVIESLDGKNLNEDVPYLSGLMTSCEVLLAKIRERIETPLENLGDCRLARLRLIETPKNTVELHVG